MPAPIELYEALFGQVEDMIRGKQLLIVPSGPLTQLPFQVLVTAAPAKDGHKAKDANKDAAWLIRDHAITVLPAVLRSRRCGRWRVRVLPGSPWPASAIRCSTAIRTTRPARMRQSARTKFRTCPEKPAPGQGRRGGRHRGVAALEVHGGLASLAHIRAQAPLPETAAELCTVGRDLGARAEDIRLGAGATERAVKELSDSGRLAHYRIVHFATHGALAGQVSGASEPGLILTPPEEASELDDGYLTASEIAG